MMYIFLFSEENSEYAVGVRQSARITFENEVYGSKTNKKLQEKKKKEKNLYIGLSSET